MALYNLTFNPISGNLRYSPTRDGPQEEGWNYDSNGQRRPALVGATVEFDWFGTAVYIQGDGAGGSYDFKVDGVLHTSQKWPLGYLAICDGLDATKNHTVSMTVKSGVLALKEISITVLLEGEVGYVLPFFNSSTGIRLNSSTRRSEARVRNEVASYGQEGDTTSFKNNDFFTFKPRIDKHWANEPASSCKIYFSE